MENTHVTGRRTARICWHSLHGAFRRADSTVLNGRLHRTARATRHRAPKGARGSLAVGPAQRARVNELGRAGGICVTWFSPSSRRPCPCPDQAEVVGTGTLLLLPIPVMDASVRGAQLGVGHPCWVPVLLAPQGPWRVPAHTHAHGSHALAPKMARHCCSEWSPEKAPELTSLSCHPSHPVQTLSAGGGLPWGPRSGAGGCLSQSWTAGPVPTRRAGTSAPGRDPCVAGSPRGSVT